MTKLSCLLRGHVWLLPPGSRQEKVPGTPAVGKTVLVVGEATAATEPGA